tara:strand:- start:3189 stop:5819 length:2631 start_codon:yes stop_codon:yes gene_type:complete
MIDTVLNTFNRGELDPLAFSREDVEKVRRAGELMDNWLPVRLGAMIRRPGFEVISSVDTGVRFFEYEYSSDEKALIELGDEVMRIWIDDALVARTAVTTTITNGEFTSSITGWTGASGSGATAVWGTGGYAVLTGGDTTDAVLYQTLTTETGAEHGLRVVIEEAPCRVKIGTSGVNSDDITNSLLEPGEYSLAFTPDANVTITLVNSETYRTKVSECSIEGAGTMEIPTPVPLASVDDVQITVESGRIFCTWTGEQFLIERRGAKSWGVADYRVDDGPFDTINLDAGLTLTPAALSGNTTLTASKNHFKDPESVGTLRRLFSAGQTVEANVSAEDNGTDSILVTGIGATRKFSYVIGGTMSGSTVTLQRSTDDATWVDVNSWTATRSDTFNDNADNAVYYYRLWVKAGDYGSGTIELSIAYEGGSIEGICRILSVTSATVANVQVLRSFGATDATTNWYRTQWGDGDGYPNACDLYEGRLWFAGKGGLWGSVSDAFRSFDRTIEGASASIYKSIPRGASEEVNWIAPAVRLALGMPSDEIPVRSSSFGEVLTQDNINLRQGPEMGSGYVPPLRHKNSIFYASRSLRKLMELKYSGQTDGFAVSDLMLLNQSICNANIVDLAVAREPDPRVFTVLANGEARVLLIDRAEDVIGWSRLTVSGGQIKQMFCQRGTAEDTIYARIAYDGTEYLCKLAALSQADSRPADLYTYTAGPASSVSGLSRFEGESVEAWSNGFRIGNFTVSGGSISLGNTFVDISVGLKITANYRSGKLGLYDRRTSLTVNKRVVSAAFMLRDFWHATLKVGRDESHLANLRKVQRGVAMDTSTIIEEFDCRADEFEGEYDPDARIYVRAEGPATLQAISLEIDDGREGSSSPQL